MKRIFYLLVLLLVSAKVMAQVAPAPPLTLMNQNAWYMENITKDRYVFEGNDAQNKPIWVRIPYVLSSNTVISGLTMSVSGSTLTVQPGYWRITNVLFHTTSPTVFTLQARDSVLSQYETVYADSANALHIAIGTQSLNPIEPNIPAGDLRVGSALITPIGVTLTQPGAVTDYVFSKPLVKQAYANPKVRTITSDTIKTPYYILPTTVPNSGDVIQAASDGTTFWSPQAIYTQGPGVLISANVVKADTILLVTQKALGDTLRAHTAHFDNSFTISNDTIHLVTTGVTPGSYTSTNLTVNSKGQITAASNGSGASYTATGGVVLSGTSFRLGSGTLQGSTVAISSPTTTNFSMSSNSGGNTVGMQMFSGVLQLTSHKSGQGTAFMQFTNPSDAETKIGYQNASATTEKSLTFGIANKGIYHIDNVDTIGDRYADTSYAANGKRYDTWIPTWKAVKSRIDSAVSHGGGSVNIYNTDGTLTGNRDVTVGANSIDWHGDNGTYAVDNLIDNTPGGSLISSQASNSAGSHYAAVNIGITSPTGWYAELATNKSGSGASIQLDGNTGNTTITNTLGSFGAQYGADYSTALRLNPNGIASVKVVKDMADSVKGTISAGASPGNPSGLLTFTASNGSNATYLRNDGLHAIDSTVVRSVANSYSLSGMQTKLNNYALTSALPVGANPTATAGSSVVNGSATTFMRSDAAPKVDSAVFRTVANSYSLSGLQTKFNGYVPTSTTVAGFPLSSNVTLAALTATDATLTFSGSYTGATARTVGLNLGNANTWTVAQSVALTALGTTQTEAQRWQNTTAAAVGAVQISPFSVWYGNNWSTGSTASVLFGFRAYTLPIQNSSGYNGEWHLQGLTALNTWADALKVDNGGTLTAVNFVSNGGEVNSGTFRNASSNASINFQTARTFNAAGNIIQFNPGSITNSSGLVIGLNATQTINQTSTASYTYNQVNLTETAVGSNGAKFVDYQVAGTSKYSVKDDGTINSAVLTAYTPLQTDASKNVISSPVGQTTLVSGTKAITITGLTTSSKAFCQLVSQGGTVTTTQVYGAVCTSNTLTITALTTAGATDTTDTSVLNYFVVVQ